MEPRISLVTLGVTDLEKATTFYRDGLGWPQSRAHTEGVSFFRTRGTAFALFPLRDLARDANVPEARGGFNGIALAHNVATREAVDATLEEAARAGARILKRAEDAFWGGRSGYFADLDGHVWEVAWNPGFPLDEQGFIQVPP